MMRSIRDQVRAMVASLPALLLVGVSGCASGKITSIEAVDPDGPGLKVAVVAEGLSHRAELCELEVLLGDYWAQRLIPLNPQAPEPQNAEFVVTEWKEYDPTDKLHKPVAKESMRVRFLFNKRAVMDEKFLSRPDFKPHVPGKGPKPVDKPKPKPAPKPEDEEVTVTRPVLTAGRLSRVMERPSPVDFKDGVARLECGISADTMPQYARLEPPPGNVQLVVKVTSHAKPGQSTWWRLELLDRDGNPLAEPIQEFQFIESGNDARAELLWQFDGNPHLLKLSSNSPEGDTIKIDFTAVRSGIPGR